jgi:hypothetical protein
MVHALQPTLTDTMHQIQRLMLNFYALEPLGGVFLLQFFDISISFFFA